MTTSACWAPGLTAHELAGAVGETLGEPVIADPDWVGVVQGAVGHVTGLRFARTSRSCVVKVFPPGRDAAAHSESTALRLAAAELSSRVPAVLGQGRARRHAFVVLERLAGERWADRRPALDLAGRHAVIADVAAAVRALHHRSGEAFGDLLPGGVRVPDALHRTRDLVSHAVDQHVRTGGDAALARLLPDWLEESADAWRGVRPVLCHHDVNGGNVLISSGPEPHVTGLVDFERSSWGDPVEDVALTSLHLLHHGEAVDVLLDAYGRWDEADARRLRLHLALLAVRERTWVVTDRPKGWEQKSTFLEAVARVQLSAGGVESSRWHVPAGPSMSA